MATIESLYQKAIDTLDEMLSLPKDGNEDGHLDMATFIDRVKLLSELLAMREADAEQIEVIRYVNQPCDLVHYPKWKDAQIPFGFFENLYQCLIHERVDMDIFWSSILPDTGNQHPRPKEQLLQGWQAYLDSLEPSMQYSQERINAWKERLARQDFQQATDNLRTGPLFDLNGGFKGYPGRAEKEEDDWEEDEPEER